MIPITPDGHNTNMVKPEGWSEDQCSTLPVQRVVEGTGDNAVLVYRSVWHVTPEELAHLVRGGVVQLECVAFQQPVKLSVVDRP